MYNNIKELVFDYFFSLNDSDKTDKAEKAIREDLDCSRLYNGLKSTVGSLSSLPPASCPDSLVSGLFERLEAKSSSQKDLETLLRGEYESRSRRNYAYLGRFAKIAALIAVAVGIVATYAPVARKMRLMSLNNLCQRQLKNVGNAMATYSFDNNGMLPSVAAGNGAGWWQVGSQREEDHSNTRNLWILVRNGYSDLNDFACPARPTIADDRFKTVNVCDYEKDFPSKDFVNYSFRVLSGKPVKLSDLDREILAADSNPLFEERCFADYDFFKSFTMTEQLRKAKSINHLGEGQNIIFSDNSVEFTSDRKHYGDDIYTVQGTDSYTGFEKPSDYADVFLAP